MMLAREFCYWMQGAFELTGMMTLDAERMDCIRKHLKLVEEADKQPSPEKRFCIWLEGALDMIMPVDSAAQVMVVRKQLAGLFQHAIDPSYPNAANLAEIHSGPSGIPNRPGMRC